MILLIIAWYTFWCCVFGGCIELAVLFGTVQFGLFGLFYGAYRLLGGKI